MLTRRTVVAINPKAQQNNPVLNINIQFQKPVAVTVILAKYHVLWKAYISKPDKVTVPYTRTSIP